jgi:hypothetical protein
MFIKSSVLGVAAWFAAAQFVKFAGFAEPNTKWENHNIFAVSVPVGVGAIFLSRAIGVPASGCFANISIATGVALILDGLATVYAPFLYSYQKKTPLESLSAIAFGGGCGILAAYLVTKLGKYPF